WYKGYPFSIPFGLVSGVSCSWSGCFWDCSMPHVRMLHRRTAVVTPCLAAVDTFTARLQQTSWPFHNPKPSSTGEGKGRGETAGGAKCQHCRLLCEGNPRANLAYSSSQQTSGPVRLTHLKWSEL
ncbi:unnamed protein product, partial [Pylaiella littoralis]